MGLDSFELEVQREHAAAGGRGLFGAFTVLTQPVSPFEGFIAPLAGFDVSSAGSLFPFLLESQRS